jgi:hypothetical protein
MCLNYPDKQVIQSSYLRYDALAVGDTVTIRFHPDWKKLVVKVTDRYRKPGALADTILCETSPGHKALLFPHNVKWGEQE